MMIYNVIVTHGSILLLLLTDCYETIPKSLIQLAKEGSSSDNITVIVLYLKEPSEIAKFSWPSADTTQQPLDNMETTTTTNTTDPMSGANENNPFSGGYNNFEGSNQVSRGLSPQMSCYLLSSHPPRSTLTGQTDQRPH